MACKIQKNEKDYPSECFSLFRFLFILPESVRKDTGNNIPKAEPRKLTRSGFPPSILP